MRFSSAVVLSAAALMGACAPGSPPAAMAPDAPPEFQVPVDYYKLGNGLRVVLSPDPSAATAVVAVYYDIGFRVEPRDRTGFAHLFEHMMFQGSRNLGKLEFIQLVQNNGGILNGSTRFDYTNYFEIVPSHTLETMLWAEADRMRSLDITQESLKNQQEVVKNEVRVNVLNQPYGGFPWLDTPQAANENWYNAHNFYGELEDLDAATLEEVQSFFRTYYAPNNAALVVTGRFDPADAKRWIQQYFSDIPPAAQPPRPDLSEPRQTVQKRVVKQDAKATRPALAAAYHMPERDTPEYFAMGLIHQILAVGRDSRLSQALVQERGLTGQVSSGINLLGNMFNVNGPVLLDVYLFHDRSVSADSIVAVMDSVIEPLRREPIDQATLDRAMVKMRSDIYDQIEQSFGFGRADLLASFALFDDDPARINTLVDRFREVTPALIRRTAEEYLRPTNRTLVIVEPGATTGE